MYRKHYSSIRFPFILILIAARYQTPLPACGSGDRSTPARTSSTVSPNIVTLPYLYTPLQKNCSRYYCFTFPFSLPPPCCVSEEDTPPSPASTELPALASEPELYLQDHVMRGHEGIFAFSLLIHVSLVCTVVVYVVVHTVVHV